MYRRYCRACKDSIVRRIRTVLSDVLGQYQYVPMVFIKIHVRFHMGICVSVHVSIYSIVLRYMCLYILWRYMCLYVLLRYMCVFTWVYVCKYMCLYVLVYMFVYISGT